MRPVFFWLALGLAVGAKLDEPAPMSGLSCLDTAPGCSIHHTNIRSDDDHGVHITIFFKAGNSLEWSVYPDEARQMADLLERGADGAEAARAADGGADL